MEILISKLEKYKLIEVLKNKLSEYRRKQLNKKAFISLYTLVEFINLDSIGYTFEDCLTDYEDKLKNQKEKFIIWKLWSKGYSVNSFQEKFSISSSFQRQIRDGIDYNSEFRGDKYLIDLLELKLNLKDFKIVYYDTHIELFGEEKLLKEFRDKFDLNYDVIWEKDQQSYHLAFAGLLANYIRKDQEK